MAPSADPDIAAANERRSMGGFVSAIVLALALLALQQVFHTALRTPYFLTGWALFATTLAFVVSAHRPPASRTALLRRIGYHADAAIFIAVLFAAHIDLRQPNGWFDLWLCAFFGGFLLSVASGYRVLRSGASDELLARHLRRQALWSHALCGAGLAHGIFLHAHGLLAYLALGK